MNRIINRIKIVGLVSIIFLSLGATNINAANFNKVFKDENLATCVAKSLNKESDDVFNERELKNIAYLDCQNQDIKSLSGISKITNLEAINLKNNKIKEASELSALNLKSIDLSNNEGITDLNSLYYIDILKELSIENIKYNKISIVNEFKNLERLDISNNNLKDISFLTSLKKLKEVDASDNKIDSIKDLSNMGRLSRISVANNKISS
ncbi:MAG: leucine-rich repeat domain-containing protein, partial [Erysipelotrichales bacterium]